MDDKKAELLVKYKKDIAKDADILSEQRDKANEDMRFVNVDGGQWENFLEDKYEGRAKLEFDLVSNYKNRFVGEWNQNRVGVEYKPDDDKTTDDDADLLNGIYRADFRDNSGRAAIDNAVDECATCGFGAFGLSTEFVDDEDPENEQQRIIWRPIHNAYNSVFFDQSAKRADKLDARWCTELTAYTKDAFEEAFPDVDCVSAYQPHDRAWNNYNGSTAEVYVATRYEVETRKETVFVYNNLASGEVELYSKEDHELIKDELAKSEVHKFVRERKFSRKRVMMSRFTGKEFIEEPREIAGKFIPIIPMYAFRAYVDGVEYYFGLVRKLKDAGRAWNVQISQLIENAASAGQEVPIFLREQMEAPDVQQQWADKNNKPYLVVDPATDNDGNNIAMGPIGYNKPAMLDQSTAALMDIIPNFIREVTGGAPQETLDPATSGKAINAMLKRENLNTQPVNEHITESITASGNVYQAIAGDIYNSRQIIRTLGEDGTEGKETLLKVVADEKTGKLIQANTISGKKFRAYADVGPQYSSMREQTVEDLKGMAEMLSGTQAGAEYMSAIISTILDNITGVGLGPLKDLNRKQMMLQGLVDPESDEDKEWYEQQMQPKEDPQQALVQAAAAQQLAEAENLKAATVQKIADAKKTEAETEEIYADMGVKQFDSLLKAREQILGRRQA